jgi:uncharacterized iron-regulated membrane protein
MTVDKARRRKAVARWHRRFALFLSLWLLVLAASGVLINHAHDWGLDHKRLSAPLQRWLYGIEISDKDFCDRAITADLDCSEIFAHLPLPMGALLLGKDYLFLLDQSGQVVEKLAVGQFGLGSLQAGFRDSSRIYLRDMHKTVLTDADLIDHVELDSQAAGALSGRNWQEVGQATENITWERFLLDMHAARFLGPLAKIFTDLVAGLILVMAVSGIWLYRLKRNGNGNGQYDKDP